MLLFRCVRACFLSSQARHEWERVGGWKSVALGRYVLQSFFAHACKGETEWFKKQRSSDKSVKAMLDHFRSILAAADEPKGQKFSVAVFKETYKTEQGVEYIGRGRMMWQGQAIEHWMTPAGGSLSADDAASRWEDWSTHYKDWGAQR